MDNNILIELNTILEDLIKWNKINASEYNRGKINMLMEIISTFNNKNPISNLYLNRTTKD